MELASLQFIQGRGWTSTFPNLDSARTLVLVFASPEMRAASEPFQQLRRQFPTSQIVGCSSAGEIFGAHVSDHSIAVAVAKFGRTDLRVATEPIKSPAESREVGAKLATALRRDGLRSVLVLSEGLGVNGTDLVHGLNSVLGQEVIVTGGLAGDGAAFKRTWVVTGGEPRDCAITAVGFYGDHVRVGHGSQGGWDIFGPERLITKSAGNILYELDGKSALSLYKSYLGDKAKDLPASGLLFPLQICASSGAEKKLVRTILAIDEAAGSLTFAGDMPEGHYAQLMRANFDRLVDGAINAAANAGIGSGPVLQVAVSCVGRRLVLGERIDEEVEATLDRVPRGSVQVGFYSYGELSPFVKGDACELHNQTMTVTTISEAA